MAIYTRTSVSEYVNVKPAGIVISVAVLIAAGFAVYENPQVREWVQNSRRKIAVALHSLGDEVNPEERQREDISMTEQLGEDAEQRRRNAREEIMRRSAVLEAQRKRRTSSTSAGFDALVDKNGRLKIEDDGPSSAKATGIDLQESGIVHRRPDGNISSSAAEFNPVPDVDVEEQRQILEAIERGRLQLDIPSDASSTHPSESLIDLTPTSEFPGADFDFPDHNEAENLSQHPPSQSDYETAMSPGPRTPHTEDGEPDFYYVHPNQAQNSTDTAGPQQQGSTVLHDASSAPSVTSSLDHIRRDSVASSDGTMSDVDYVRDVHTPASWSEVGSVISSGDENTH